MIFVHEGLKKWRFFQKCLGIYMTKCVRFVFRGWWAGELTKQYLKSKASSLKQRNWNTFQNSARDVALEVASIWNISLAAYSRRTKTNLRISAPEFFDWKQALQLTIWRIDQLFEDRMEPKMNSRNQICNEMHNLEINEVNIWNRRPQHRVLLLLH